VNKTNLDTLDNEIAKLLTENGRMPIGEMAKKETEKRKNQKESQR
jgi:DNA-binding Lrp family transcriptional regulator